MVFIVLMMYVDGTTSERESGQEREKSTDTILG